MTYKLYDITGVEDYMGFGLEIVTRNSLRVMIRIAYRIIREVYKSNAQMDLSITGDNFSMMISSIPNLGIVLIGNNHNVCWTKEV